MTWNKQNMHVSNEVLSLSVVQRDLGPEVDEVSLFNKIPIGYLSGKLLVKFYSSTSESCQVRFLLDKVSTVA